MSERIQLFTFCAAFLHSNRETISHSYTSLTPNKQATHQTCLLLIPTSNPNGFLKNPSLVSNSP